MISRSSPVSIKPKKAVSYTVITFPPVYKVYGSGNFRPSVGLIFPRLKTK